MQLTVAVNVSAHDLTDVDFPQYVRTVLAEHGLSGQTLELEVTEGALVYDLPSVRRTLEALHALGVRIFNELPLRHGLWQSAPFTRLGRPQTCVTRHCRVHNAGAHSGTERVDR